MKLIYCPYCGDMFKLRLQNMKTCECGKVKGRYIDNSLAEVSEEAISVAIGNGSFNQAVGMMKYVQKHSGIMNPDRQTYIAEANIEYAWVRPNDGDGNPHTKIIKEEK